MNAFWEQIQKKQLQELEQGELPYPGGAGIQSRFRRATAPARRHRTWFRAAVVAVLAVCLTLSAWAAYEAWRMPEPRTYQGDPIQTLEEHSYSWDPALGCYVPEDPTQPGEAGEPAAYPDSYFLNQAQQVLDLVDRAQTHGSDLKVTRQLNQSWDRQEVLVSFRDESNRRSVTFDAESGYLIGVSALDAWREGGQLMGEAAALAAAQSYYDQLPYARGYQYGGVEKFDDGSWMYYFNRPVTVELWGQEQTVQNDYEQVRITIDPRDGSFQMSHCFYVPLLDDHQPGEEPLTQAQAAQIAQELDIFAQALDAYECTGEVAICLPAPQTVKGYSAMEPGTDTQGGGTQDAQTGAPEEALGYRYASVSRLCWSLQYTGSLHGFSDSYHICVDLYTGEVLAIDATK